MSLTHTRAILDTLARAPYPIRQYVMGMAYLMMPRRLPGVLPLIATSLRDLPRIRQALLPSPQNALDNPDGLCGLTGDIKVDDLMFGYSRGLFVMSHLGPLKWWAPRHRMVLFFDQARIEKTVRRLLRGKRFAVTFDQAFSDVVGACASPRSGATPLTWITPRIRALFESAYRAGYAHSVEVWQEGSLVGGIYGLAVGRVFFTESQFHTARDASKVGFVVLNRHLQHWGFAFNDGKHATRYLADCGMVPVTRTEFSELTSANCAARGHDHAWRVEPDLLDDQWQPAESPGMRMEELLPGGSKCRWNAEDLLTTHRSPTW